MQKHLYFLCPTDHLESVVNKYFKQDNYFWTSLGNSVAFDDDQMVELKALIEAKEINKITFILSRDNQLISDALRDQDFSYLKGLGDFYYEIARQSFEATGIWQTSDLAVPVVSKYLEMKLKTLKAKLDNQMTQRIELEAKIYMENTNQFSEINTSLFDREAFCLN